MTSNALVNFYTKMLMNPTSSEFQKQAFKTNNNKVLTALAKSEMLDPEIEALMKDSTSAFVIAAWADRPGRTEEEIFVLADSKKINVLKALASKENLSDKIYEKIALKANYAVAILLLKNSSFPEKFVSLVADAIATHEAYNATKTHEVLREIPSLTLFVSKNKNITGTAASSIISNNLLLSADDVFAENILANAIHEAETTTTYSYRRTNWTHILTELVSSAPAGSSLVKRLDELNAYHGFGKIDGLFRGSKYSSMSVKSVLKNNDLQLQELRRLTTGEEVLELIKVSQMKTSNILEAMLSPLLTDEMYDEALNSLSRYIRQGYYHMSAEWNLLRNGLLAVESNPLRLALISFYEYKVLKSSYYGNSALEKIASFKEPALVFEIFVKLFADKNVTPSNDIFESSLFETKHFKLLPAQVLCAPGEMTPEVTKELDLLLTSNFEDSASWEIFNTLLTDFSGSIEELCNVVRDI